MTSQQDKYIKKFSKHSLITKGIVKKTNIGVIGKNFQLTNETSAKQSSSSSRKVISPDTIAGLSKDWERTPLPPPNEPTFEDEDVNNGDSPANELGEQPDEYTVAEEAKKPFRSDIISLSDFYPAYANQNSIEPNEVSALLDIQHNLRQLSHEVIENFIQKAQDDPELGETVRQTKEFFKLNIENTKRYLSVLNSLFEEHDRLNNALNIKSSKFIKETLLENYYSKNEFNQAYNTKILIQIFNEFNLFLTRGPRISSAPSATASSAARAAPSGVPPVSFGKRVSRSSPTSNRASCAASSRASPMFALGPVSGTSIAILIPDVGPAKPVCGWTRGGAR